MDETHRPRDPTQPGPVAEGQLDLNRELIRRSPEASREQLAQEQEDLQRARPEAVREAAAGRPVAGGSAPEERAQPGGQGPADDEASRSPFTGAAATTRDPAGEAG
jgi:hypothetical protein